MGLKEPPIPSPHSLQRKTSVSYAMTKVPGGQREANKDHHGQRSLQQLAVVLPQPPAGMAVLLQLSSERPQHSVSLLKDFSLLFHYSKGTV